jgi:hypothetical protein
LLLVVLSLCPAKVRATQPGLLHRFSEPATPTAYSPNGRILVIATDKADEWWDVAPRKRLFKVKRGADEAWPGGTCISADGAVMNMYVSAPVARAGVRTKVRDLRTGKLLYRRDLPSNDICYSADRRFFSTIEIDWKRAVVVTRRMRTGKVVRKVQIAAPRGLRFDFDDTSPSGSPARPWARSPDGSHIALNLWQPTKIKPGGIINKFHGLAIFNGRTGRCDRILSKPKTIEANIIDFLPDNRTIALQGVSLQDESIVCFLNVITGRQHSVVRARSDIFEFSPSLPHAPALLADANFHGHEIWLWDIRSGRLIRRLNWRGNALTGFIFSPDGKTIAAGGYDGKVVLWRIR